MGELVRLRKESDLTQKLVAERLDWSQAKIIRIEGGKQSITQTDLQAMLSLYGVEDSERIKEFIELNRGGSQEGWWYKYRPQGISADYLRLVGYEAGASSVRAAQNAVIPGALQTSEYADIITRLFQPDPEKVVPTVNLRLERQTRMAEREKIPQQTYVLDEAVVRRHVGFSVDPGIMVRQLRRLIDEAGKSEVDIHVIPFDRGAHRGMLGPMMLLSFDGPLDDVVYLEGNESMKLVERLDQVADYSERFEQLTRDALSVEDSADLINEIADAMLE